MKITQRITTLFLFVCVFVMKAANDTIVRVERKIPDNYKEAFTSKDYIYQDQEPPFFLKLKMWLAQFLYSIYNLLGINSKEFYYVKLVFYTLIIIAAIYIIARMIFYKEGNWIFKKSKNNSLTYQTEIEEIELSDFNLLVKESVDNNNYRLAVKYYYLWVLQKLSEQEIIELSNLKTNSDYQLETENTPYFQNFKSVSYYYNYIWYGEFMIDKEAFEKIESSYQQLLNQLK
ncbi:flagellar biogenesis protein FliO [Wenyingzhuangia heitensis]|uniref:Flagellar biogenesis protein FliO n=1 Tax=Wenyingzhuangia heitensis TaxID=1487859 RepID=A0ABX0U8V6_9FLAO|nr:hypothetical protein [Wenyingzhuangia heitensis]NIJ44200.1 flagellar biogenesis protein FliO [Wenyingzhuangia heitensis]